MISSCCEKWSVVRPVASRLNCKHHLSSAPNQTVQRTGASRFAQRQIERHRRLAPVADLCVSLMEMPNITELKAIEWLKPWEPFPDVEEPRTEGDVTGYDLELVREVGPK